MYSLCVDSTEWVECQLHLEGATATQNIADNLKMWEDTNKSIERTTCLKKKKRTNAFITSLLRKV